MSNVDKRLARLLAKPPDFTWRELEALLDACDCAQVKGSGSRRRFIHRPTRRKLFIHKPHPSNVLKAYQIEAVISFLETIGIAGEEES